MPVTARHRALLGATLLLAPGVPLISAPAYAAAAHQTNATQLLKQALTDARARGSVRAVLVSTDGGTRVVERGDAGTQLGAQSVTASTGVRASVRVIGKTAYIAGNAKARSSFFGLPPALSKQIGDHWLRIPSSNPDYATVAAAVTLPSLLAETAPTGHLTELPGKTLERQRVIGIRGQAAATTKLSPKQSGVVTMYVTDSARPMPVEGSASIRGGGQPTVSSTFGFSRWGERVEVQAPSGYFTLKPAKR